MIDKAERDVMRARAIEYRNDPLLASQDALRLWTGKALRLLDALDEDAEPDCDFCACCEQMIRQQQEQAELERQHYEEQMYQEQAGEY